MDDRLREFERRAASDGAPLVEIIAMRSRVGACVLCAEPTCFCIGSYLYESDLGDLFLRRVNRDALPFAIIGNVDLEKGGIEIVPMMKSDNTFIPFSSIKDIYNWKHEVVKASSEELDCVNKLLELMPEKPIPVDKQIIPRYTYEEIKRLSQLSKPQKNQAFHFRTDMLGDE